MTLGVFGDLAVYFLPVLGPVNVKVTRISYSGTRRNRPPGWRSVYARCRMGPDRWFVYILRCADDSLYTGIARDVAARLRAHAAGRGARYTRSRGPLVLCAQRRCGSKGEALRLELAIKRLARNQKLLLLSSRRLGAFARKSVGLGRKDAVLP